ncbi:hypothetical protein [Brunnivagina elsteri]|uniref:hypothetical protein n=1 Tax=Brunnivagina elsteri TaxID=1247191 RepID=UPI001178C8E3|nr:hypothetical protein [Calothrix elsteri]
MSDVKFAVPQVEDSTYVRMTFEVLSSWGKNPVSDVIVLQVKDSTYVRMTNPKLTSKWQISLFKGS